jgi:hypothetical protein
MGWELRNKRYYLYRNVRVDGKPVKEYLGTNDVFGFGAQMADDLDRQLLRQAKLRRKARQQRHEYRQRIDGLLADATAANGDLRIVSDGLLMVLGYRRHNRGEWRMQRELSALQSQINKLKAKVIALRPMLQFDAPADDAEAVELFAQVRTGDADARNRLHALVRERKWVDWLGDLGRQATRQLICKVSGWDKVWEVGLFQKFNALYDELVGPDPSVLERLLARRVANGWLTTHALELELTLRPPDEARDCAYLDAALSRAQKRYTDAIRELARARLLQAPQILAQLNVAAEQTVVNAAAVAPTAAPRVLETVRTEPDKT